ncbi:MAG: bifunctional 4-hydroxy-2-oxoglutarate aldolase/2-dehydro-3-deoxy-phosphogluconate aldolase [Thermoguttaceae bacterium]|nr:bifunctional 4-hydroxy-2-oxoglutarate aldolase/2-dehydro-3-deoxy-phosphogluconate aldolase [Thermoguttaceae bacterium]
MKTDMGEVFSKEIVDRIEQSGIIAVLVIDEPQDAVPTANALLDGGIDVMELAFRTSRSLEALAEIHRKVPQMLAGAGTIISPEQVGQAKEAGAAFGVSPGLQARILQEALRLEFPFAPGLMTPSEIELALSFGCRQLKLFPAEPLGGMNYIKAIHAPYAHLGVRFIPLGGLKFTNFGEYVASPTVLACGGSWLAPRNLIKEHQWEKIAENTALAVEKIKSVRTETGR